MGRPYVDRDFEGQTLWVGERRMLRMKEGWQELVVQRPGELRSNYRGLPRAVRVSQALRTGFVSSGSSLGQFPAGALMKSPLLSMLGID